MVTTPEGPDTLRSRLAALIAQWREYNHVDVREAEAKAMWITATGIRTRLECADDLEAALRDAASALASPPTRFVWLLERTVPNGPRYYDGTTNGTADPLKAVQFARKQDAEWGQARVPYGSTCWTVVEHGFMSALASPPEHDESLRDSTGVKGSSGVATASANWEACQGRARIGAGYVSCVLRADHEGVCRG